MIMINEIIGTVLQVIVFTLIPFLVYIIRNKSVKGFLGYIGLKNLLRRQITWRFLPVYYLQPPH